MYNVCSCIYIIIHRHANVCKEEKLSSFPIVTLLFTICRGEKRHIVNSSCFIHGKIWVAFFHVTPQDAICCYRFCIHTDSSNEGEGRLYLLPFLYLFLFCVCVSCRISYIDCNWMVGWIFECVRVCDCVCVPMNICSWHNLMSKFGRKLNSDFEVMVLSYALQDLGLSSARWTWGLLRLIWVVGWGYLKIRDS